MCHGTCIAQVRTNLYDLAFVSGGFDPHWGLRIFFLSEKDLDIIYSFIHSFIHSLMYLFVFLFICLLFVYLFHIVRLVLKSTLECRRDGLATSHVSCRYSDKLSLSGKCYILSWNNYILCFEPSNVQSI